VRRSLEAGALRPLGFSLVFWLLVAAFFTTRTLQRSGARFDDLGAWAEAATWNVPSFLLWGLLTPAIEQLRRAWPLATRRRRELWLHAGASILVAPLQLGLLDLGFGLAEGWSGRPLVAHDLAESLPRLFHLNVLLYWLVALGGEALAQARRYREERTALARLEAQLGEARLAALRMQLHPHFLFNTLNSIAELMHTDVVAADRMLERLSGLLETALQTASEHEVALAEELDFLERYLEVERVRFRDRLAVRFEIDPAARERRVPALVLQPLVENAVRHGIGRLAKGGEVVIRARLAGDRLLLTVENDAPGAQAAPAPARRGAGVGLSNTAERLRQLYGSAARLEVRRDDDAHYRAEIEIERSVRMGAAAAATALAVEPLAPLAARGAS
jgi:two-component sensor histidine kinase